MGVTIKGLDKALKDLASKEDEVIQAVKDVLADTAKSIELDASQNAVISIQIIRDQLPPRLAQDLNWNERIDTVPSDNGFGYRTGLQCADEDFQIEAWTEFGTGLSARQILSGPNYTPEIRAIAKEFYRNGRGTIKGVPYLMPAFFKNTANLVTEIENEINKNTK